MKIGLAKSGVLAVVALAAITVQPISSPAAAETIGLRTNAAPVNVSLLNTEIVDAEKMTAGVKAYRAGDYDAAWTMLRKAGDAPRAKRYLGFMLVGGKLTADHGGMREGVALLSEAAQMGDYAALVRLEDLRREGVSDGPTLSDMVAIEIFRAEKGDAITAWRLARRYDEGDGVDASETEMVKWLTVAADANMAQFPKANEAAFRLCAAHALGDVVRDAASAREWCAKAADSGHTGAAIVLRRLAQLND